MFIKLLFLFIAIPILEIFLLLKVGNLIGAEAAIALVLITGIAGAYLARTQGVDILRRIQSLLNDGRMPTEELIDGAMILAGGLLLLTPGLATDLFGFCLLVPLSRKWAKHWLRIWISKNIGPTYRP